VLFAIVFFTPMLDRILEPFQRVLIEFISHGYATI
jgi:hypothetical protein